MRILKLSLLVFLMTGFFAVSCQQPESEKTVTEKPEVKTSNLSSWAEGPRTRIESWVNSVTDSASADFIPVADRIAVFDNDGTLWPEQPVPTQLVFAIHNLKALSSEHPEWTKDPILNGALNDDLEPLKIAGVPGLLHLVEASHTNQTVTEFHDAVHNWISSAKSPKLGHTYKEAVYQPMLELLDYLRDNSFKVFIVSGGGADFMRVWAEEVYGIPPYQVIGSYGDLKYEVVDGKPVITKVKGDIYIDDKAGKPNAIHRFIGKVPVFCGGNSDGDQAMMQYTSGSKYKSMCVILHHTDSIREYTYDLHTLSGHLETALVEAAEKNWLVIDMKNDFIKMWPYE